MFLVHGEGNIWNLLVWYHHSIEGHGSSKIFLRIPVVLVTICLVCHATKFVGFFYLLLASFDGPMMYLRKKQNIKKTRGRRTVSNYVQNYLKSSMKLWGMQSSKASLNWMPAAIFSQWASIDPIFLRLHGHSPQNERAVLPYFDVVVYL